MYIIFTYICISIIYFNICTCIYLYILIYTNPVTDKLSVELHDF